VSGFIIISWDENNASKGEKHSKHLYCYLLLYRLSLIPSGQDAFGKVARKQNNSTKYEVSYLEVDPWTPSDDLIL